jgi:hypothetical protein
MKIVFRIVLITALAMLGVWLWTVLFPSPEKIIRRRLTELARTASISIGEGDLARLAAARRLAGFFSTNVEVNVDLPGLARQNIMDRDEITQAAMIAHTRTVKFPDISVTLAPGRQSAMVDLTVEADVPGEQSPLVQEMKFTLKKIDGEWLIIRVETVRTLA